MTTVGEAFDAITELLFANTENRHGIFTYDGNEILCPKHYQAEGIADLLEDMGIENVLTGYYDPEEDKRNGEVDARTGYFYVDWD